MLAIGPKVSALKKSIEKKNLLQQEHYCTYLFCPIGNSLAFGSQTREDKCESTAAVEDETTAVGPVDVQRAKESQSVIQQLPFGKISVADTFPVKFWGMTSNRVEEIKQGRRNKLANKFMDTSEKRT